MLLTLQAIKDNVLDGVTKKAYVTEFTDDIENKWLTVFHIEEDLQLIDIEFLGMDEITDYVSYAIVEFKDMKKPLEDIENDILDQLAFNTQYDEYDY